MAPTLAFAADITVLPEPEPARLEETDLVEAANQLGLLKKHQETVLLRVVMEMESRGVSSPGGLSRVDWLRSLVPSLAAKAAKAVVTCALAFNDPAGGHYAMPSPPRAPKLPSARLPEGETG